MIARGRIAPGGARDAAPFSGQLMGRTGDEETVTIAFVATTPEELGERLAVAGEALSVRRSANNAAILRAGDAFAERQRQVYEAALAQLRRELTTMLDGRGAAAVASAPTAERERDGDDPAGALDTAENR